MSEPSTSPATAFLPVNDDLLREILLRPPAAPVVAPPRLPRLQALAPPPLRPPSSSTASGPTTGNLRCSDSSPWTLTTKMGPYPSSPPRWPPPTASHPGASPSPITPARICCFNFFLLVTTIDYDLLKTTILLQLRFRFDPADEYGARAHVGDCCSGLIGGAIYYARIKATMDHFRKVEGRKICDKIAGQFYLTEEQYRDQRQMWIKQDCWNILAAEWSSVEFKMRSIKNRGNRYSPRFKPHKGGSNSIATIRQKMSKKLGRDVSEVEAWVYTHRGSNPEDSNSLNTDEATACLEKYKEKAIELNGPEFDWLHSLVDVRALYQCSCGRPHGKWALFNGIVNDREVLPELKNNRALSLAAKRRRQEADERARKEASESRLAKEYAQKMFDWSKIVLSQNETMQKFMENVAAHTGMPAELVPSPLPHPPPPPGFCVSTSPLQSTENAPTFGSVIREETPDETISRIANGVFRRHENATTSGGGTYSPPQEEFPFL